MEQRPLAQRTLKTFFLLIELPTGELEKLVTSSTSGDLTRYVALAEADSKEVSQDMDIEPTETDPTSQPLAGILSIPSLIKQIPFKHRVMITGSACQKLHQFRREPEMWREIVLPSWGTEHVKNTVDTLKGIDASCPRTISSFTIENTQYVSGKNKKLTFSHSDCSGIDSQHISLTT